MDKIDDNFSKNMCLLQLDLHLIHIYEYHGQMSHLNAIQMVRNALFGKVNQKFKIN